MLIAEFGVSPEQVQALTVPQIVALLDSKPPMDDLVDLQQLAVFAGKSKRTLERYIVDGTLPAPDIQGGDGKPHKWFWRNIRPALSKLSNRPIPAKFPGSKII